MMWLKRIQLGLLHTATAITLLPFTSTLNRVLIVEMGLAATVVTLLVSIPYFFAPIQVVIGSYADRNPIFGLRRTPYILIGILMCVAGPLFAPEIVALVSRTGWTPLTVLLSALVFGLWGMGYNLSAVSYLSLASELDEEGRGRTIAIMFTMMILGIIFTSTLLSRMIPDYTVDLLTRGFWTVSAIALVMGLVGLSGVERRSAPRKHSDQRHTWGAMAKAIAANPHATLFFWYLVILLVALLGQDVILEAFAAQALGMRVGETTRITSIWGTCFLITLLAAGWLQMRLGKLRLAKTGGLMALVGFLLLALAGELASRGIFYIGISVLGLGTGLATVTNLSLMLDMTAPENVGLYMGAWGMANALSRLVGQMMSGVVRDSIASLAQNVVLSYVVVFVLLALCLFVSLFMLGRINVAAFQSGADRSLSLVERAALLADAGD